jgi:hypothetical protein
MALRDVDEALSSKGMSLKVERTRHVTSSGT